MGRTAQGGEGLPGAEPPDLLGLRRSVVAHHLAHGVRDRRGLVRFVTALVGHRWLDRALCEGHDSPFDALAAAFFDETPEIVVIGPRGGWKTKTLALLNAVELLLKPGVHVAHLGASRDQAMRALSYTREFLQSEALVPFAPVERQPLASIVMRNGARLEILSATALGLNSSHVPKVRVDEYELLRPELVDELRMIPSSYMGHRRSILYISSRKFRGGNVDRFLSERKFRSFRRFVSCWRDTAERCPESRRGAEPAEYEVEDWMGADGDKVAFSAYAGCGSCPLLAICRGALARAEGWVPLEDLIVEYQTLDRATWLAQKESLRVATIDALFRQFSRKRNVREVVFNPALPLNLSVDFGGGVSATAALFWQRAPGDVMHVLAEYVKAGAHIHEEARTVEAMVERLFPGASVGVAVCDSAQPVIMNEWNAVVRRFRLVPVRKKMKKDMLLDLMRYVQPADGNTRYFVHPSCAVHIRQMEQARPARGLSGAYSRSMNKVTEDDTVDAACYAASAAVSSGAPRVHAILADAELSSAGGDNEFFRTLPGGRVVFDRERYMNERLRRLIGHGA